MLTIKVPSREMFNELTQQFFTTKDYTLQLEHSLVSLSKWESKYKKPFLTQETKSISETLYYVKCMTITQNIPDEVYTYLTDDHLRMINNYIEDSMTATTFHSQQKTRRSSEQITSELIYYWMVSLQIPMECQKWHLNRLLTLIRICDIKNQPAKKMGKRDVANKYASLNAARRARYHSRG